MCFLAILWYCPCCCCVIDWCWKHLNPSSWICQDLLLRTDIPHIGRANGRLIKWTWMRWLQNYSSSRLLRIHGNFGVMGKFRLPRNADLSGCLPWYWSRISCLPSLVAIQSASRIENRMKVLYIDCCSGWCPEVESAKLRGIVLKICGCHYANVWYINLPNSTWYNRDWKGLKTLRRIPVTKFLCIVQGGARPAGGKAPHQRGAWGLSFVDDPWWSLWWGGPCSSMFLQQAESFSNIMITLW